MKKKEIQENTYGGIVKLRQDIDNSTYQLFQRLEKSPSGEIKDTFINNNKKVEVEISYTKSQGKKISRTTADLEILLASLLTQNNFERKIDNLTLKDLLFYLNKEYSKQNYERLKMDLKILKTMNRNIIAEEFDEDGNVKDAPKRSKIKMQSIVIEELQLDSRSRRENWITLSTSFVERVKEKFIVHLPPKEVFFKLNSNEKNVCERLITILRPRGRGAERKFGLIYLKKTLDEFTTEILGHKYKYTHKKKEVIKKVLENLSFLVRDFSFEKEKSKRKIYVIIKFFTYEEYIENVEKLRRESKYFEELELFPKEELEIMEQEKPQIFYDIVNEGVSEVKLNSILRREFEAVKVNREELKREYEEKELRFTDYLKAKYIIAKLYADKEVKAGNDVNFEAIFMKAVQNNWENRVLAENEKREKQAKEKKAKEVKISALEKRKKEVEEKWSKIIEPAIEGIVSRNPEIVGEIWEEIESSRDWKNPSYDKNLTPMENYRNKIFIKYEIDAKIIEKYNKVKVIAEEKGKEVSAIEEEIKSVKNQ